MSHADHVGSLLRPAELKEARARHEAGTLSKAELRTLEDAAIVRAIGAQEKVGVASVTDGELRRAYWHYDFLAGLTGLTMTPVPSGGSQTAAFAQRHRLDVTGRIAWQDHPFVEDFKFVARHASKPARITIPSPTIVHFRLGHLALSSGAYRDLDSLSADLVDAYAKAVAAFAAAGCKYLQIDEVNLAMICDPAQVAQARERGVWRDDLAAYYAGMINDSIRARPADMRIGMHLCRGNFKSTWAASGGYEPVADVLFNGTDVDTYFMEFDSGRAGGFEPLRFLPKGKKQVVLGVVTTKSAEVEDEAQIVRRIEEAARWAPLAQLAVSPQCGFASTEEGNALTEREQWAKLALCVEVAGQVWGKAA
ncbi:MAG: 5-methyltetrahydropteroyltriglutamate--homocysteine S-methyltransferase [Hyphomicrobiales bacterium]|nr:5-methyltetrahydropteroyltriglutamate--homocysteine S-methyltransferase [Hyphomicrobiales bacterium]